MWYYSWANYQGKQKNIFLVIKYNSNSFFWLTSWTVETLSPWARPCCYCHHLKPLWLTPQFSQYHLVLGCYDIFYFVWMMAVSFLRGLFTIPKSTSHHETTMITWLLVCWLLPTVHFLHSATIMISSSFTRIFTKQLQPGLVVAPCQLIIIVNC